MDADGVPLVGQSLDLKLLEPLQHKRTLAYINHFIIQITGFLNRFACQAEAKLAEVDRRTLQIQTTLQLLEAKLASLPELEGVKREEPAPAAAAPQTAEQTTEQTAETEQPPAEVVEEAKPDYIPVSKDPRYAPYFKKVAVGIPPAALHAKMRLDGLDPLYLDNPDQPAPPRDPSSDTDTDQSYESD